MLLHVHPDVHESHSPEEIGRFAWRMEEALVGASPWVKALGGPWGSTVRVRVGRRRALFSWATRHDQREAWLHEIGWRREIYDRETGLARARAWMKARDEGALDHLGYVPAPPLSPSAPGGDEMVEVQPALSEAQARFVRAVLPLEDGDRDERTFVLMAKGPPGSGKTVVAADCARDAFLDAANPSLGEGGADVVVLVPSGKLHRHYRDELRKTALPQEISLARAPKDAEPRLWLSRFGDFFQAFSDGDPSPSPGAVAWWDQALRLPALQRWARDHPCVREARFAELMDACFGDREDPGGGVKDALSLQDRPLYAALGALTPGQRDAIQRSLGGTGLRWQVARRALAGLQACRPGRPMVWIVDEAQDLVPAEWETLLRAADHRIRSGVGNTVVALLGDENQRVAPTAFAWAQVDAFVRGLHPSLTTGLGTLMTRLPGSFRICREIAAVANSLVEGRLCGDSARRGDVAAPEELREGGSVAVVLEDRPRQAVEAAMTRPGSRVDAQSRVVCIGPEPIQAAGVDAMDVREAKGLEYDRLLAFGLFLQDLDWDVRSRAYVTLTRARERVLLVLDPGEWGRVSTTWEGMVEVEDPARLPLLLDDLVLGASSDPAREQRERIDNLVDAAEQANTSFPLEVLDRAARVVEAGDMEGLVAHLEDVMRRRPAWHRELRGLAASPGLPPARRVAAWLLLGDTGAAWMCSRDARLRPSVLKRLQRIVDMDFPLAAASQELRCSPQGAPDADLVDLIVMDFRATVAGALQGRPLSDLPRYRPTGARPTDLVARTVQGAVDQEVDRLTGLAIATEESMASRRRARRRELSEALERRAPARKADELLARLDALTQRVNREVP